MQNPSSEYEVETWASDAPVSLPEPPFMSSYVPMDGFVFTVDGIAHGLNDIDIEAMKTPTYGPERVGDV